MLRLPLQALTVLLASVALGNAAHLPAHKRHASPHRRFVNTEVLEEKRNVASSNTTLVERDSFSGRGTYYITGLGACGIWNNPSDYIVAQNSAQYGGGYPGPNCFKNICVQANGVTVCGVQITDECPTCDYGGLDMSQGLFERFADTSVGVLSITWWYQDGSGNNGGGNNGGGGSTQPSSTPPASTTPDWTPPPSTSTTPTWTWVAPSTSTTPTSTYTPPSTSTQPPSTSTSTSTSTQPPSSSTTIVSVSRNATSTNPFVAVHNTTASVSASDAASSSSATLGQTDGTAQVVLGSNIDMVNGLVTNYGLIIVAGAQVKQ